MCKCIDMYPSLILCIFELLKLPYNHFSISLYFYICDILVELMYHNCTEILDVGFLQGLMVAGEKRTKTKEKIYVQVTYSVGKMCCK